MRRAVLAAMPSPPSAAFWLRTISLATFVTLLIGCDGASKYAVESALASSAPKRVIPGFFDVVYRENHDTAFSVFRRFSSTAKPELLALVASVATALIIWTWWRLRRGMSLSSHVACALTVAGAVGNVIDRVSRGYVIDFLHLHRGRFDWPVFNFADVFVVVGGALLLVEGGWHRFGRGARGTTAADRTVT